MGGGFNFGARDRFLDPGLNLACPVVGFSIWKYLQGTEDIGAAIAASNTDMASLDGRNDQADHIVGALRMVLRVVVRPLTTQQEVVIC